MKVLYTLDEAAELTPFSADDLRLAVTQAYRGSREDRFRFPRLNAKKGKRGALLVTATDLQAWAEQLPDA